MTEFPKDLCQYERHLGTESIQCDNGKAEVILDLKEHHLNIGKSMHGGVVNGLLDIALSAAVTSLYVGKPERVVTLQMNVNFLRPAFAGDRVIAKAEVIKRGSTIVYTEGAIYNQENKLIAKASGDWFVKKT